MTNNSGQEPAQPAAHDSHEDGHSDSGGATVGGYGGPGVENEAVSAGEEGELEQDSDTEEGDLEQDGDTEEAPAPRVDPPD